MPTSHDVITLACPNCHTEQKVKAYTAIDLSTDPKLELGILTDSVFTHTCTHCGASFTVTNELLVTNAEVPFAILLAPDYQRGEPKAPDSLKGYIKRVVPTINQLKEKVMIFQALMDDRAVELCKLYLSLQEARQDGYYLFTEHRDGNLKFSWFDANDTLVDAIQVPDSLYTMVLPKAKGFEVDDGVFTPLDALWALDRIGQ
ncbi:MAG: CpXC domain-containing protein [Sphaerochaeta sp.]|jgi:hypothetical protein|nr:CpXC domain-containing protein [Sphaerochaeta sp.]MCH3920104.1 CpXC domain-containing protein [Sphaerochaeta sp.]MCI2045651.1 CpXC domain-containing protein [Sphaerochaeta sp.]MCI2076083.1 CpXC domain-containing protein [Sphaerochaeta sp.]MCI2096291.1 CpXC domain-containing protein [Sphaerochaeta sp.]